MAQSDCKKKCYISILMVIVAVLSSVMGIMSPIVIMTFSSNYFVTFIMTFEFLIFFGFIWLVVVRNKSFPRLKWRTILELGISNAFMAIFILYSSDPSRTPPVMQSTLTALSIIPTILIRCCVFGKNQIHFDKIFNVISIIFLIGSVVVAGYPLVDNIGDIDLISIFWCVMYLTGICILSWYNVAQEKYVKETETTTLNTTFREKLDNKIILSFFSRIPMLIVIIFSFGCEYLLVFDNETSPLSRFNESFYEAFTQVEGALILQGFIFSYFLLFFSAIYLNGISTNYHMILTVISNPMVALFFTIFPSLNPGIQYPLWVTITSLVLSISSVILWIGGESQFSKKICRPKQSESTIQEQLSENLTGNFDDDEHYYSCKGVVRTYGEKI